MDRCYTADELSQIVKDCLETGTDLLPYYCRENKACWWLIKCCIHAVVKYGITPELYWHGNSKEFEWLLTLLADTYPSSGELLALARKGTTGEIQNIARHHYQHIGVMFDFVKSHHGYAVLSPTAFMQNLYPGTKGLLYVYTSEKWAHKDSSGIDSPALVLRADEIGSLGELLGKKLGLIR